MILHKPMRLSMLVCLCGLTAAQAQNAASPPGSKVIEGIEFRGLHVSLDTVKATIVSKVGDVYNQAALRRDFTALWKSNRFDNIQLKTEAGAHSGVIVRFEVIERQEQLASNVIEGIEFHGLGGVTQDAAKATIVSKVGDVYNQEALHRDVTALWKTNRFDDVQVKTETGPRGGMIVRFVVIERS